MDKAYDVLVAGAGLAGLRAAIAAAEAGARVLLASKAAPAHSTSAAAWGGLSGAVGGATVDDYLRQLEAKAEGLGDPRLRRALAEDTAFRLEELSRFGVDVEPGRGHVMAHGGPYSLPVTPALAALLEHARVLGVEVAFGRAVTGVARNGGRVVGAELRGDGTSEIVGAGAVVLAGGGFAGLMPHNDNQGRNLGDALAVALLAGAEAVDLEFMSFQPVGLADPRWRQDSIYARPLVLAGTWTTPSGEGIGPHDADAYFRRRAMELERDDERYDVLVDLSAVPAARWEDDLAEAAEAFFAGARPSQLRAAPLAHYTMGGIAIDEHGATGVEGLYAAGECTGGIFGADRPGGGALADCVVFGARAGDAAAKWAADHSPTDSPEDVAALKPLPPEESARIAAEAGWAAWNFGGLYKHAEGLRRGIARVEELAARVAGMPAADDGSCEGAGAVIAASLHLRASLSRRETRGEHRRLDFPEADEQLAGRSFRHSLRDTGGDEGLGMFDLRRYG